MLPPSSKGTPHGLQSIKGNSALDGGHSVPAGHLGSVGQTPKYLNNASGLGAGLNYNSN